MHSTTILVYKGHGLQRKEAILPPVSGPYWEPCFQFLPGLSSNTAASHHTGLRIVIPGPKLKSTEK